MAFIFCTGDTRGGPLRTQINNVMGMSQRRATGIASKLEMRRYLLGVQQWADNNSRTAQQLLQKGHNAQEKIHLVGMRNGGYTCFDDGDGTPAHGGSTVGLNGGCVIYINIDVDVEVNPGGSTVHAGFRNMHPYIVFLHELGHAIQKVERPELWVNGGRGARAAFLDGINNAARRYGQRARGLNFGQARTEYSPTQRHVGMPWNVRIEYDNVYRHERPICQESGQPMRDLYGDIREM